MTLFQEHGVTDIENFEFEFFERSLNFFQPALR
jgi:hypothetical protein